MAFGRLMNAFARPCSYISPEGESLGQMQAFISPLRYKNKMYLYGVNTEIGYNAEGYYLYIGPPEADITCEGCCIECAGDKYKVDRAEKVFAGTRVFYIWAVIRKMVEEDEWTE